MRPVACAVSFTLLAALSLLPGCVGYTTYPAPEHGDAAFNSPNVAPGPEIIAASLRWITDRYPVGDEYAINLPPELSERKREWIFEMLDDPDARTVRADPETVPVFHIGRIWIRGKSAEVDVFRPVQDIPGPEGSPVHQMVTLTLGSGLVRWRVESARSSMIGAAAPPALHTPDTTATAEAEPRP